MNTNASSSNASYPNASYPNASYTITIPQTGQMKSPETKPIMSQPKPTILQTQTNGITTTSYLTCQPSYYVSSSGTDTYASVTGKILSTNNTSIKSCCINNLENVSEQSKTLVKCCQTYFPQNGYLNTTFTGNDDSGAPMYRCF